MTAHKTAPAVSVNCATIPDLDKPDAVPDNLSHTHDMNDEALERIYIGRQFKNNTERLEKLFDLYTKMTSKGIQLSKPPMRKAK